MMTPQPAAGECGSDTAAALSPLRVLIVEDNPDDAELLLLELRRGGFAVESSRVQTAAALEKALAAQTWGLIISDYSMPQFSALDALAVVRRTGLDLPFIIVSGAIGEDTAVEAMKAGAHDYLMKGNLARLVPAIERELREAAVRREKRRAEEARWEEAQIAEALARVAGELISSRDTPIMLNRLCQLTTEVLDCERSHALVWRPEADAFMLTAGAGYAAEEWEAIRTQKFSRRMLGHLLAQLQRHDVVQATAPNRQRAAEGQEGERQHGLYAALRRGAAIIGILAAQDMRPHCFTRRHERTALGVAQLASMALENARLVAELNEANRLKSEFMATVSHELRTPLNVIIGYTDLLLAAEFDPLTPNQMQAMQPLARSARDLYGLITATLDFSRLEAGCMDIHLEKIGVPELVTELCSEAQELPRKTGVQFEWHAGANLPKLQTDPRKLKIALKNLLDNAFKFTEQGRVVLRARPSKGGVEFAVTDTGVGIKAEALSVIFEPYRQVDGSDTRRYGGVGLGLHIAKRLVELLGGAIAVESAAGQGSTFRVWVPRQPKTPAQNAEGATALWTRNGWGGVTATGPGAAAAGTVPSPLPTLKHPDARTAPAVPHLSAWRPSRAT